MKTHDALLLPLLHQIERDGVGMIGNDEPHEVKATGRAFAMKMQCRFVKLFHPFAPYNPARIEKVQGLVFAAFVAGFVPLHVHAFAGQQEGLIGRHDPKLFKKLLVVPVEKPNLTTEQTRQTVQLYDDPLGKTPALFAHQPQPSGDGDGRNAAPPGRHRAVNIGLGSVVKHKIEAVFAVDGNEAKDAAPLAQGVGAIHGNGKLDEVKPFGDEPGTGVVVRADDIHLGAHVAEAAEQAQTEITGVPG